MPRAVHLARFSVRIAGSSTFLVDRARRRARLALALVCVGIAALVGGFVASQQGNQTLAVVLGNLGVFVGLGSVLLGVQQFLAAGRDREAGAGEAPVVAQLSSRLGDDYTYLRRVTIPHHGVEADGILAGPSGAIVLAIRSLQGRYVVRGNDWFVLQEDGAERPWNRSPTWELARPVRALQRAVREEGLPPLPVHGAVVLVAGRLQEASLPGAAVVPVDRIASYVEYLRQGEAAEPQALRLLLDFLEPHAGGVPRPAASPGR